MRALTSDRAGRLWLAAAVATSLPILLNVLVAMWRSPFPINETVSLLQYYSDASPASFFNPTTRSWYRPLYHLTWWGLWRGTGSLASALLAFRLLEVGCVVALFALFVWELRPRTMLDWAAATFAVAVLIGTPGFRANLELPLLMTLIGMPIALVVWMILEHEPRWWHAPVVTLLLLVATGFKEQGLVIAPLVVAAWWAASPGATRTTAAMVVAATVAYLVMRAATKGHWAAFEQDIALGFTFIPAADASARFGAFPFWIYAYNATATVANILFSEPTDGQFAAVWNFTQGRFEPWQINHLWSSAVLTILIVWWGAVTLWNDRGERWSYESRVCIAAVITLAASGALGFNYSRERLGGMAAVFYAMAAYFAVRALAARAAATSRPRMLATGALLLLLGGAWQLRSIGTAEYVRLVATKNRREWIVDVPAERAEHIRLRNYGAILDALAPQGVDPASTKPVDYPRWFQLWLGHI